MFCINFIQRSLRAFIKQINSNRICRYNKQPLRACFDTEILRQDGTSYSAYIVAKHLVEIDDQLYIEGCVEVGAYYRMLPVKQIMVLCDCATGEYVSRPALAHWLRHRVRRALFQCA